MLTAEQPATHHIWIYRRTVPPILALLRMGAEPRTLAWSIALGLFIGINPVVGSTTVLCLAVCFAFRLNVVACQIANHAVFPLQLVLLVPFLRVAAHLFRVPEMPLSPAALLAAARTAPLALVAQLWRWESRALLLWALIACVAVPAVALALTPLLRHATERVRRRSIVAQ